MWDLNKFVGEIENDADTFHHNMVNQDITDPKSKEEWMQLFLDWLEWKTDRHDDFWRSDDASRV